MANFSTGSAIPQSVDNTQPAYSTTGSSINATGNNDNMSLALINVLGQVVAVGESHDVELGFNALSIGTDNGNLELISAGDMQFQADAYNFAVGAVNFDAAVSMDTTLGVSGAVTFGSTLDVTGDTSVSTFDSSGATSLATAGGVVNIATSGVMTTVKGTLNVEEAVTLDSTLGVTGLSTLATARISNLGANEIAFSNDANGTITGDTNLTWDGSTLDVGGAVVIDSTLSVGTNASVSGNLTVTGNLTVNGTNTLVNSTTLELRDNILLLAEADSAVGSGGAVNTVKDVGFMFFADNTGGQTLHTGFVWDNDQDEFIAFTGATEANTGAIDTSGGSFAYADIRIKDLAAADGTFSGDIGAVNATFSGNLVVSGNTTLGDADSDTVTFTADIASGMIPSTTGLSIGATSDYWASIFATNHYAHTVQFTNTNSGSNTLSVPDSQEDALSIVDSGGADIMVFDSSNNDIEIAAYDVFITNGLDVDGTTNLDAVDIDGGLTANAATIENLNVANGVVFTDGNGALDNDATLTFDTSNATNVLGLTGSMTISVDLDVDGTANLDVVDIDGGANIAGGAVIDTAKISDLTSGRVVLAGTDGELQDSANLTFDGSALVVTGTAQVTSTLAVGSTSTFADAITLDGNTPTVGEQTITFATGADGRIVAVDDLHVDGDNVYVEAGSGTVSLVSSAKTVSLNNITFTESATQTHNDYIVNIGLGASTVAFLYEDYKREETENSDHFDPYDVLGVKQMLGFKPLADLPTIDLSEDRGQGHLYTVNTSVVANQLTFSGITDGDSFELQYEDGGTQAISIVFQSALGTDFQWSALKTLRIKKGADDIATVDNLKRGLEDGGAGNNPLVLQLINDGAILKIEQEDQIKAFSATPVNNITGNLTINGNGQADVTANFVNTAINQPELYWEDVKLTKWTGSVYTFGIDLQAAYDSASADQDVPSIAMQDNYDLSIELGTDSSFTLDRSAKASLNRHSLRYQGDANPNMSLLNNSDIKNSGLSFGHSSGIAGEDLQAGEGVSLHSRGFAQVVFAANTADSDLQNNAFVVVNNTDTTAGGLLDAQGTPAAFTFDGGGADDPSLPSPYNLKSAIDALSAKINTKSWAQSEVIDLGSDGVLLNIYSDHDPTVNAETAVYIAVNHGGASNYGSNTHTDIVAKFDVLQHKTTSQYFKADASDALPFIGIVARDTSKHEMVHLHLSNTVFEVDLCAALNGNAGQAFPTIGEELFLDSTGDGTFIPASALAGGVNGVQLSPGDKIFSIGYCVGLPEQCWDSSTTNHVSSSVGYQVQYLPRFVAIKP